MELDVKKKKNLDYYLLFIPSKQAIYILISLALIYKILKMPQSLDIKPTSFQKDL